MEYLILPEIIGDPSLKLDGELIPDEEYKITRELLNIKYPGEEE
jgi:hypothetical protein